MSLLFMLDDRDLDPDPDPYLVIKDPDPGGRKTYGSATRYPKIRKRIVHVFGGLYGSYLHDSLQRCPLHGKKKSKTTKTTYLGKVFY